MLPRNATGEQLFAPDRKISAPWPHAAHCILMKSPALDPRSAQRREGTIGRELLIVHF
jgi:hypothetical protein